MLTFVNLHLSGTRKMSFISSQLVHRMKCCYYCHQWQFSSSWQKWPLLLVILSVCGADRWLSTVQDSHLLVLIIDVGVLSFTSPSSCQVLSLLLKQICPQNKVLHTTIPVIHATTEANPDRNNCVTGEFVGNRWCTKEKKHIFQDI